MFPTIVYIALAFQRICQGRLICLAIPQYQTVQTLLTYRPRRLKRLRYARSSKIQPLQCTVRCRLSYLRAKNKSFNHLAICSKLIRDNDGHVLAAEGTDTTLASVSQDKGSYVPDLSNCKAAFLSKIRRVSSYHKLTQDSAIAREGNIQDAFTLLPAPNKKNN